MTSLTQPVERADARTVPTAPIVAPAPKGTDPLAHLPSATIQWIALDRIQESALNPRKDFDKEGIAELAESIRSQGLQQNLIVRPTKKADHYELMGGARRLRALRRLKAEGAMCKVVTADDGQSLAAQIVENLQRKDLAPLEEAEAFAKLQAQDPKVWTAAAIAKAVGKTDRFVQQRLAIAKGLSAPLKKKFAEGELSIEAARTLAPLPASVQSKIPDWSIKSGDAADIKRQAYQLCIPESAAKFDITLYKGAWIEDDKGRRYFSDTDQFRKQQRPAAEKKLAEVQKDWPNAELVSADEAAKWHWADEQYVYSHGNVANSQRDGDQPARYYVPKEKCTAIVWISLNGEIRKALGVCSAAAVTAAATKRQEASSARYSRPTAKEPPEHRTARQAFNTALAKAAATSPDYVGRLILLVLLTDACRIDDVDGEKMLPKSLRGLTGRWANASTKAKLWTALSELRAKEVHDLTRKLVLADVPSRDDHEWQTKQPLMLAMAATLKVTPPAIEQPAPKAKKAAPKAKKPAANKKGTKK